jgi:hypothetical protein
MILIRCLPIQCCTILGSSGTAAGPPPRAWGWLGQQPLMIQAFGPVRLTVSTRSIQRRTAAIGTQGRSTATCSGILPPGRQIL